MPQGKTRQKVARPRIDALSHELRLSIIGVLWEHPASANEVATALGEPADKIRYQLRLLRDADLIEVLLERRRRGTIERVYAAREEELILTEEEMLGLPEEKRREIFLHILKASFRSTLRALSKGTVLRRNSLIHWSPIRVDAQGLEDLSEIHVEAVRRVEEVKAASAARLGDTDAGISATSVVVWFENAGESL
jgi:DNA-binding transcriptional ArsR family regulator